MRVFSVCLSIIVACLAPPEFSGGADAHAADSKARPNSLNLLQLQKKSSFRKLKRVKVQLKDDPAYRSKITLEGYPLESVLQLVPGYSTAKEDTVVVFVASDGFRATAPLRVLQNGKGVLATKISGHSEKKPWKPFLMGKEMITPGPFYLVWRGISYENKSYPWPWGVVEIEFASSEGLYPQAYPRTKEKGVRQGFVTFSNHCISCHAINGAGGSLGPEFNYPKSITEYWSKEHFVGFAKNPASYRIGSRMYPKSFLSDADFAAIWVYLSHMKGQKIKPQ